MCLILVLNTAYQEEMKTMHKIKTIAAILIVLLTLGSMSEVNAANRFNLSYIYFGNTGSYYQHVANTQNSLDEISPSYFNIKNDGSLDLSAAIDVNFIAEMHRQGIKVVPFLSNHWDRASGIKALQNRQQLSNQIVSAIANYNLDGVNVDIENVTEAERAMYTDFVRLLREKLPKGKTLAVAVAANPWGLTKGWQGSYDYTALAQYSDYLMIMAYDESYTGGPAGPVASYSFVENTIKQALTKAPKEKLVLGIPFYGRYWKNGAAQGGYGVSNTVIDQLVKDYHGTIYFDNTKKSPYAVITIKESDVKPTISGTKLQAGTYTIWFENEASIKYKLDLVNEYDLKGTGSWSLGQETKDTWNYYSLWLNGHYFKDVQDHWALASIVSMAQRNWMTGVTAQLFAPDKHLSRAEAAVVFVRAMGLQNTKAVGTSFSDISKHWAKNEIELAAQHGIVEGTGNGKFSPDNLLSRQEMAVMLERVLKSLEDVNLAETPFSDVTPENNSWSYNAIVKLAHYNIFTGNPDGTFGAGANTTRGQMAVLMDRVADYLNASDLVLAGK